MRDAAFAAGAAAGVIASPYLAMVSIAAAERSSGWWRPRRIGATRAAATAGFAGTLSALAACSAETVLAGVGAVVLAWICSVLAVVDVEHHRLPDPLVVAAAGATSWFVAAGVVSGGWHVLIPAVGAGLIAFVVLYAAAFASPGGVGLGDVKLGGVLAGYLGWFGWPHVVVGIAGGFVIAGLWAACLLLLGRAHRGTHIPLGPFLVAATFAAAALA